MVDTAISDSRQPWLRRAVDVAYLVSARRFVRITSAPFVNTNLMFAAVADDGTRLAVRVGMSNRVEAMRREFRLGRFAHASGIAVCHPAFDAVELIAPPAGGDPLPVSFWHWQPGAHEPVGNLGLRRLGETLRGFHHLDMAGVPSRGETVRTFIPQRWQRVEQAIAERPSHPWHRSSNEMSAFEVALGYGLDVYAGLLEKLQPQVLCHGDMRLGNVALLPNRAALLDLEMAGRGAIHGDVASLLNQVAMGALRAEHLQQIFAGYGTSLPPCDELYQFGPFWQLTQVLWRAEIAGHNADDDRGLQEAFDSHAIPARATAMVRGLSVGSILANAQAGSRPIAATVTLFCLRSNK